MANIQHKNIANADLHEPKGIASATAKQVYVADGVGSGVWTKYFESAEQTLTAGSSVSISHGLGGVPSRVEFVLRCKTTELGYAVGDEIIPASFVLNQATFGTSYGCQVVRDATNVGFSVTSAGFSVLAKNGLSSGIITLGNWKGVLRAWNF